VGLVANQSGERGRAPYLPWRATFGSRR
jgi:hypothetical protein